MTPEDSVTVPSTRSALLALALLAPVPSLGVVASMVASPGPIGNAVFIVCKLWLVAFPALWYLLVERGRVSWSPPRLGGLGVGALTGFAMGAAVVGGFWIFASPLIRGSELKAVVESIGLDSPAAFLAGATYWVLINSVIEEYVYRWFVLRQCRALMPGPVATFASAAVFTAHHVIVLSVYLDATMTSLASVAVFVGGALWSWLYLRYRSVWPAWISHAIVDIAVFAVGWQIVFGR